MNDSQLLQKQLKLINNEIAASNWTRDNYYYYELLARLHLLLVKNKIRRAYFDDVSLKKSEYFEDNSDIDSVIIDHLGDAGSMQLKALRYLKQISSQIGLQVYEARHSYFYLNKNDVIPDNILDKFCRNYGYGRFIWVFNDPSVKNAIDDVIQGNIRIGDLLEYPKCCVDWLTETQTTSLIDCYYLCLNKSLLPLSDDATVEFLMDYFESDVVPDNEKRILDIKKNHVAKTISKYPFVFHQACSFCLENSTSPTAKLNQKYGNFAQSISEEFYQKLIAESKKMSGYYD
ncbi:MAG: hypothetical protein AB1608_08055 [Thermoproteota archaeon]